jgi:predicted Zn-dependent protease
MLHSFYDLADRLTRALRAAETLTLSFSGERSDFVRFNHAKVRQAGSVQQQSLRLRLIADDRQVSVSLTLAGTSEDALLCEETLGELRAVLRDLPPDPHLLYATEVRSTQLRKNGRTPAPEQIVQEVTRAAAGLDLVGIYACGTLYRGFANSLGQRNWHEVDNFNFEWSLYHRADKATKAGYAGFDWDSAEFDARMRLATEQLELLRQPARTLPAGTYRVFLAPRALEEVIGLLHWGGFSAKARATKRSPLLRMEQGTQLNAAVSLAENTADGVAPAFQGDGYLKPDCVALIDRGRLADPLISPRTAREYALATNGANGGESPESLDMAAGDLATQDVLDALDTGIYVNNLWYLNYSDRPAARITGMTRFATFWVENGKIVAPLNVMRFDDSLYRMLGENLLGLTREREMLLDASTYDERSTSSSRLPGALVEDLRLTL